MNSPAITHVGGKIIVEKNNNITITSSIFDPMKVNSDPMITDIMGIKII